MKAGSTAVEAGGGPRYCPRRRDRERTFAPGVAALSAKFNALSTGAAGAALPTVSSPGPPPSSTVRAAVRIFEQQQQHTQGKNGLVVVRPSSVSEGGGKATSASVEVSHCSPELMRVIASLRSAGGGGSGAQPDGVRLLLRDAAPIVTAPAAGSITGRRRLRPKLEILAKIPVDVAKPNIKAPGCGDKATNINSIPSGSETVPNGGYLGRKEMFSLLTLSEEEKSKTKTEPQPDATDDNSILRVGNMLNMFTKGQCNDEDTSNVKPKKDPDKNETTVTVTTVSRIVILANVPTEVGEVNSEDAERLEKSNTVDPVSQVNCTENSSGVDTETTNMVIPITTSETVSTTAAPVTDNLPSTTNNSNCTLNNSRGNSNRVVRSPTYVRTVAHPLPGSRLSVAGTTSPEDSSLESDLLFCLASEVKPNTSFLWGACNSVISGQSHTNNLSGESEQETRQILKSEKMGLQCNASEMMEELLYDDVGRPYSPLYDDVGPASLPGAESKDSYDTGCSGYEECCANGIAKPNGNSYQDDSNIYDDVDVSTLTAQSDFECYESICGGSSCDQSNSLYGVASTIIAEDSSGSGQSHIAPHSETSDEWVDLEQSDCDTSASTPTILIVQERSRNRHSPGWSRQVRRTWSKSNGQHLLKSKEKNVGAENSSDSDADHHYEMLDDIVAKNNLNNNDISIDDFDSFDSDESDEADLNLFHKSENNGIPGRLPAPPPPQNIYGITRIAEAAGKKMLKLRKSFGRMRSSKRSATQLTLSAVSDARPHSVPPPPPSESPPVPVATPPQSAAPSPSSEEIPGTIPARGRKYWSLRKFRRATSVVASSQLTAAATAVAPRKTASTFYLAPGDSNSTDDGISRKDEIIESKNDRRASSPIVPSQQQIPQTVPRPSEPPPLPPTSISSAVSAVPASGVPRRANKKDKKEKSNSGGSTSWYAECGLFDALSRGDENSGYKRPATLATTCSGSSWYAEAGLWGSLTSSPNSSDVSEQDNFHQSASATTVSESSHDTSHENVTDIQTCFKDEPLYQFYNASAVERDMLGGSEMDSDGYEEVGQVKGQGCESSIIPKRPSAMELIRPHEGQRTLWCQIPEVVNSAVLSTLNSHQKRLQEAKFEIITSEASYMNSLNVLENHFMSSSDLCDESVLSKNDRRILFGNVMPVKNCSEKFLADLEHCWQDDILLQGIGDIIYKHATGHFNIYIKYCSNQIYLDRTLRTLKDQHGKFSDALKRLESSPSCHMLSLHSFLMLPMQRVTRLPLLVDAVLAKLSPDDSEYHSCEKALAALNKVVQECNEGARRMERMEEILILSRQLEFGREVRPVPIISSSRWLVRSGEVTQLIWRGDDKLTFGKRLGKITLHLFLFTDLLLVTKKRSEESYTVLDYCPRNLVQMASAESVSHLPVKYGTETGRNLLLLTMLQNHESKTTEMVLSCPLESDRQRWLEAVAEPQSENPDETVYEEWDCPQVHAVHAYIARQPDELSLEVADVVNVLRKVADGWYQGERIRDGERGWFPANHTVEIASAHVRAKNLKQRYRLLALSANFLESQRKQRQ